MYSLFASSVVTECVAVGHGVEMVVMAGGIVVAFGFRPMHTRSLSIKPAISGDETDSSRQLDDHEGKRSAPGQPLSLTGQLWHRVRCPGDCAIIDLLHQSTGTISLASLCRSCERGSFGNIFYDFFAKLAND